MIAGLLEMANNHGQVSCRTARADRRDEEESKRGRGDRETHISYIDHDRSRMEFSPLPMFQLSSNYSHEPCRIPEGLCAYKQLICKDVSVVIVRLNEKRSISIHNI